MNTEQEVERDEFVVAAMILAIKEIEYLHRLLRRTTASGPCVVLTLNTAIQFMEEQ